MRIENNSIKIYNVYDNDRDVKFTLNYIIIRFFNIVINLFDFAHSKAYTFIIIVNNVFKHT